MDTEFWATFVIFMILALFAFGLIFAATRINANLEHSESQEHLQNWKMTWKAEPKIFDFLEENKQPDDFPSLISTISEFLDYCWFHPFIADLYNSELNQQKSERDLQITLGALDNIISSIGDLNSHHSHRFEGYHYSTDHIWSSADYSLDILYTIAEFCGIEKENGLEFYVEKLDDPDKKYAHIDAVPKQDNFVNLGEPNLEILEKCTAIDSAFDGEYDIRDISTFDLNEAKELEHDLARTLRCCVCNILNTRLTEDIVTSLQGREMSILGYENDRIKRRFLDAMIIEIWAICGGLAIERKTYSDLRFQFSIKSMQLEKDRPKSAFRTKKSTNKE